MRNWQDDSGKAQAILSSASVPTMDGLRCCDQVGQNAELDGRPYLENRGKLVVGDRFRLGSIPVQSHLVVGRRGVLCIGNDVTIGYGAAIAVHKHLSIGDGTVIAPFVSIADTDFHIVGKRYEEPEPRPVCIGREVRLGSRVIIRPGANIGNGVQVAAGSVVSGKVSDNVQIAGVPARPITSGLVETQVGDVSSRVQNVVAESFRLNSLPNLSVARTDLPMWDSFAALKLLLALEDAFGVILYDSAIAEARRIQDLVDIVESARSVKDA